MEIKIADNWKWITIDTDGTRWIWEKEPEYLEDNMSWEIGQEAGRSSGVGGSALEITFGDDIQHARDKIWKRNGEDWEYAGGQLTKENAVEGLSGNIDSIFDYLGFIFRRFYTPMIVSDEEVSIEVTKPKDWSIGNFALHAHKLAQLIKDAEGGNDAN